jgi:hypothetical protein
MGKKLAIAYPKPKIQSANINLVASSKIAFLESPKGDSVSSSPYFEVLLVLRDVIFFCWELLEAINHQVKLYHWYL